MAAFDDRRTLERPSFFTGQRLLAADLNDVVADHRWRRQLHNRSLHQPGIGNGFPVIGKRGDREVIIGPGYALDAFGREIISTREKVEPVPPVAGDPTGGAAWYDLVVSFPDDDQLEEAETRRGVCGDDGTVRLLEEPIFCWVPLEEDAGGDLHPSDGGLAQAIATGQKIRLARAAVRNCRLEELSTSERRDARPPAQPKISCGLATVTWRVETIPEGAVLFALGIQGTLAGVFNVLGESSNAFFRFNEGVEAVADDAGTDDSITLSGRSMISFDNGDQGAVSPFFLVADVNTSAAGFRGAPNYSAGLRGERQVVAELPGDGFSSQLEILADGIVSIEQPTATGFTVRVLPLLLAGEATLEQIDPETLQVPWKVQWMGVES